MAAIGGRHPMLLGEHPGMYMPVTKEIEYFNRHYSKGDDWYQSYFRGALSEQIVGEFTSSYLHHPDVPKRLFDYQPEAKLIICVRNPVDRLVSQYHYSLQAGAVPASRTLGQMMNEKHPAMQNSFYYLQIRRFLKYFP